MSAIRSNDVRRIKRSSASSPYSRSRTPTASSSSLGSIWNFSRFFSFLAPFVGGGEESSEDLPYTSDGEDDFDNAPITPLNASPEPQVHASPSPPPPPPPPPRQQTEPPRSEAATRLPLLLGAADRTSLSPQQSKTMDMVSQYCADRAKEGRELTALEVNGLMDLIQKAEDGDVAQESFRFSTAPSTPARSPAPSPYPLIFSTPDRAGSSSLPPLKNTQAMPSGTPRKALARNPNGSLVWTGAGSARRTGKSPSRGNSPLRTSARATPLMDNKRRRVGEDKEFSTSESSGSSLHDSSTTNTPASTSTLPTRLFNKLPPLQLRASIIPQSTNTPANPSPLRQAYTRTPSTPGSMSGSPAFTSQNGATAPSPSPSQRRGPSRSADVLTEIIDKATSPPKPDLSNPYQTASPVKMPAKPRDKKKLIDRKGKGRETEKQEVNKTAEAHEERKQTMPSPKAIIEATTPKGAKRSRPPPGLIKENTASPSPLKSASLNSDRIFPTNGKRPTSATVEDDEEDDAEFSPSPPKKQKSSKSVTVEEVEDADVPSPLNGKSASYTKPTEVIEVDGDASSQKTSTSSANGAASSSIWSSNTTSTFGTSSGSPFSAAPTTTTTTTTTTAFGVTPQAFGPRAKTSIPREPSKLRSSFIADDDDVVLVDKAPAKSTTSSKPSSSDLSTKTIPESAPKAFTTPETSVSTSAASKTLLASVQPVQPKVNGSMPMTENELKAFVAALPESALPIYTFATQISSNKLRNFSKEREAAKEIPEELLPKFDFSKAVNSKRSNPASTPAPAFNWAAAGLKVPAPAADGSWICTDCKLDNPASADECTICKAPRPDVVSPKPTVKAFDWAAAGLKAPDTKSKNGEWDCAICGLHNEASATVECGICGTART